MRTYGLAKVIMHRKMKGTVTPVQALLGMSIPIVVVGGAALAIFDVGLAAWGLLGLLW